MKIKLIEMKIRNFKGFKTFDLKLNGNDTNIFGDNGTGKTSLYDAFLWCLFGKNSVDQSDTKFDWKPLDVHGQEIHNLETEVILKLDIDGESIEFARNITEKWTRKRGSVEQVFDGHTTAYYINGLKVKQKDYKERIEMIVSEDTFKVLTNLSYFSESMNWKDRRATLIELSGDITDQDVIESNDKLEPLSELDANHSIDEHLSITKQQKKQINKQVNDLPGRIDEVERSLPDISSLNKSDIETGKYKLSVEIDKLSEDRQMIRNGFSDVKIKSEITDLKSAYKELESTYKDTVYEDLIDLQDELQAKRDELSGLKKKHQEQVEKKFEISMKCDRINKMIDQHVKDKEILTQKFFDVRHEQMPSFDEHAEICPTCGQDLPFEEIAKLRDEHNAKIEQFNINKSERLKEIQEDGKQASNRIKELQEEYEELNASFEIDETAEEKIELIKKEIVELETKLNDEKSNKVDFKDTDQAKGIIEQIEEKEKELSENEKLSSEKVNEISEQIKQRNEQINKLNDDLYKFDLYEKQQKRMQELIDQQKELNKEFGKLEKLEFLIEEFIKTKVNMLTDHINSHFKIVKFKLFDEAINGGLIEVCEPTVNGKNYSTGLNNAARINAGLDIINALMNFYDVFPPVFVDNAEGVNELIDVDAQLITLNVSRDKKLKIGE